MQKQRWNVQNVRTDVCKAISEYCKDMDMSQARFLAEDKRLKPYLKK